MSSCCHCSKPKNKEVEFLLSLIFGYFACIAFLHFGYSWAYLGLALLYVVAGIPVFKGSFRDLKDKEFFTENTLMLTATLSAIGIQAYYEAVAVMIFLRIGEFFETLALKKSEQNIKALLDISPHLARKKQGDEWIEVLPAELKKGDIVLVRAGEKIPSDGIILRGESEVDYQAISGESLPVYKREGEDILGGSINLVSALEIEISTPYDCSSIARLISLVQEASQKKSKVEKLITSFAKIYTPSVFALALCIALLPPILGMGEWKEWIYRSLVVLMVSCPCALVLSVPLGYFGGIGGASKRGILIKGGNFIEALGKLEKIFFDKTGTLTQGKFEISSIHPILGVSEQDLLSMASCAEHLSSHPIAQALKSNHLAHSPSSHQQINGMGMVAQCCGREILAGNAKLMQKYSIPFEEVNAQGSVVYIAKDRIYQGYILIQDKPRSEAKQTLKTLKSMGIEIALLSGDSQQSVEQFAKRMGIGEFFGGLLPQEKLERFIKTKKKYSAFVGDGINDAPTLSNAEVGISLGGAGSDLSKESADVIILNDDLSKIPQAITYAKRVQNIIKQNIAFALIVKGLFVILGAMGVANMWEAVFGDVGVSLLALLNAMRVLRD